MQFESAVLLADKIEKDYDAGIHKVRYSDDDKKIVAIAKEILMSRGWMCSQFDGKKVIELSPANISPKPLSVSPQYLFYQIEEKEDSEKVQALSKFLKDQVEREETLDEVLIPGIGIFFEKLIDSAIELLPKDWTVEKLICSSSMGVQHSGWNKVVIYDALLIKRNSIIV